MMKKKKFLYLLLFSLFVIACDDTKKEDDKAATDMDQAAFLANLSDQIIVPNYTEFKLSVNELKLAIDSFVLLRNQTNLDLVQLKLKQAYIVWQKVSFLEFGPAAQIALRGNANVYPADVTKVESNINNGNANLDALGNSAAKGFPTLDYLLNHTSDSAILQEFTDSKRGDYLNLVSNDLNSKTNLVIADWASYQNTFKTSLGTNIGSSTGMLINALNQHLERYFRDGKIGIPIGVRSSGIALPDNSEAYYGAYSFELIQANFTALKNIYHGSSGLGLDDYLVSAGAADLNDIINTQITIIESKINQFSGTMPDAIQNNLSELNSTYSEIQKLIVFWKVDMPSRLGVLITYQDNDGD